MIALLAMSERSGVAEGYYADRNFCNNKMGNGGIKKKNLPLYGKLFSNRGRPRSRFCILILLAFGFLKT
jgi:hypothetical protein